MRLDNSSVTFPSPATSQQRTSITTFTSFLMCIQPKNQSAAHWLVLSDTPYRAVLSSLCLSLPSLPPPSITIPASISQHIYG
ncbi:hypothetical protein E2C01_009982 [Portunus trituberculatus]|uniref:Uncharacterized protein n=1 Tax=Portunus trituberculatus TaxID=210409 RepID=A0A5B7D788_PORTR|nr:hypothetical protein [Portunus trituberculatus]